MRHLGGVGDLQTVYVFHGFHQNHVHGRLAHGPLHLFVSLVADQHDRIALASELDRL